MGILHPKLSEERSETIVSPSKSVNLKIKRSNPNVNSEEKFDDFEVPIEKWTTVLDALLDVKSHLDHSVGIRLMIGQMGYGIGKAQRPDYPYKPQSLNMKGKACIYATLGVAALAMWYGMAVMFA